MTTTVWVGRPPAGYEAQALREISTALSVAGVSCHLLANFILDGREIDLLAIKPDGIFLVELKYARGAIHGAINGGWSVANGVGNGAGAHTLNAGSHGNPYVQMLAQYRVLTTWLEIHKREFLAAERTHQPSFRPLRQQRRGQRPVKVRSLLAFYPELPAGSQLHLDWKVEPVSYPDLAQILVHQASRGVDLQEQEIVRLAERLHMDRWDEPSAAGFAAAPAGVAEESITHPAAEVLPTAVERPAEARQPAAQHRSLPADRQRAAARQPEVVARQTPGAWWRHVQFVVAQYLIDRLTQRRDQLTLSLQLAEFR